MSSSPTLADNGPQAPRRHYDLMIIGTGSGNMIPGPEFNDTRIAIVEKGAFGGTCLNVGCIPTKMYVYAADIAEAARESEKFGIHAHVDGVDWPAIVRRIFERRIDPIARGGENYRRGDENPTIDVYDQFSRFIGPRTLETGQGDTAVTITADRVIVAAGSRPFVPPVITESDVPYHTNEDILRIPELPGSMIILGGGVIAAEFAHVFSALGVEITVINRSSRLLKKLDTDISQRFTEIASNRWRTYLGRTVTKAERTLGDAAPTSSPLTSPDETSGNLTLTLDDGTTVSAEALLVAMGRTPNGDLLNATDAEVDLDDAGRIVVNSFGETTAPRVWALGDVSSPHQLKHVANHEAKVVKHNVLLDMGVLDDPNTTFTKMGTIVKDGPNAGKQTVHHANVPAGVFTHPQIATVGMTEQEAQTWANDNNTTIAVTIQAYGDVAYGWAMEDDTGFVKLIADRTTHKLLGAHLIGPQATTLIHQFITMIEQGLCVSDVAEGQYWIHPALSEVNENALIGLGLTSPLSP
ncbi:mycothione reductase [Corynebacterium kroppenstedtii]|uniref:mycothione reductase n=1 Tax=Corynebacterium sp. PCR 32 TaxID=3351342 RepID=UPI0030A20286